MSDETRILDPIRKSEARAEEVAKSYFFAGSAQDRTARELSNSISIHIPDYYCEKAISTCEPHCHFIQVARRFSRHTRRASFMPASNLRIVSRRRVCANRLITHLES